MSIVPTNAQMPYFEWVAPLGNGPNDSDAHEIVTDQSGNSYTLGYFQTNIDFDPGPGSYIVNMSTTAIFLLKLDSNKNFVWVKTINGIGNDRGFSLFIDSSDHLYLTGLYGYTVDLDPGPSVFNVTAPGTASNIFVVKLDLDGNFIWGKSMGGTGQDAGLDIISDSDGNVLVTGSFQGTSDFDPGIGILNLTSAGGEDIFVVKLDALGNLLWAKRMGGTLQDRGWCIEVDSLGNVYTAGSFKGTVDFDPGPPTLNLSGIGTDEEIFLQKLDANGNLVWAHSYGNNGEDRAENLHFNANGELFLTGLYTGTVDFDAGPGVFNLTTMGSDCAILLMKLNLDGNLIWAKSWDGSLYEYGKQVSTDSAGNIYLSGGFQSTLDFDNGPGIDYKTPVGDDDVFVLKLDPNGDYIWSLSFGELADDRSSSHSVDSEGNVYTVGHYWRSSCCPIDFDFGTGEYIQNVLTNDDHHFFIEKISQCISVGPPVADVLTLPDITVECKGYTPPIPTATHDCAGTVYGKPNLSFPIDTIGSFIVNWTYDANYGSVTTQTQNITITGDLTNPVPVSNTLPEISHQCSITPTAPIANDNCDNMITGFSDISFPITSNGLTTITWTYEDENGNIATQTQNVNITGDTTEPVPSIPSLPDVFATCAITPTAPTAIDNCSDSVTATTTTPFPISVQGTTTLTWVYDDGNGNISTQQQDVIISDIIPPIPDTLILGDVHGVCSLNNPYVPTAIDNCSGQVYGVPNVVFPITTAGFTIVTWTFEDENGNIFTQNQSYYLHDTIAPIPDDMSLPDVVGTCVINSLTAPTAIDNCLGVILGIPNINFPFSLPGQTLVTWTFDDGNGNISTISQNIIIPIVDTSVTQTGIMLTANEPGNNYQWLNCNTNTVLFGETSQSFTAIENGSYAVEINDGICIDTSACFNITEVGISANHNPSLIRVYPNPISDELFVQQENRSEIIIIIQDASGRIVLKKSSSDLLIAINTETYASGTYLLSVEGNGGMITKLIIKL
jgi:hypothetical protein